MKIFRALLVIVVALASVEVSGSDESLPPPCIVGNHNLQSVPAKAALAAACPTQGRCDDPFVRNAAIPDPETPIKYITVKFQSVCKDDGSSRPFSRPEAVEAIDWLNSCYEPWRIQFVFDHRTVYSTYFNDIDESWQIVYDLGALFSIEPQHNLNILTTHFWCEWEGQRTLCGGALYAWDNPVANRTWSVLMTPNHWLHGGLICHEVGHNFGLIHTFGEFGVASCGPCDEVVGASNRNSTGDFCSDTPPTPSNPWNTQCAPATGNDRCSGRPWGETDYRNWMAYTPYAPCKDHFTPQQAGRMHCWLEEGLPEWISYAKIDSDVDFGAAPLLVQFDGVTSMTPVEWDWDFGDGTTNAGQTSSHVYSIPGVYKTTVKLNASEGQFEATMSRDVWVHADHLVVEDVEVSPGDQMVRVPIRANTSIPVDYIDLPLHWDGPANMTLDSVNTVGFGSGSFPEPEWLDLDADNGRACLRLWTVDSLAMEPGEGVLADLWFSVDSSVSFAGNEIRLEDYGTCQLQFVTDRGPYIPEATDGSVLICEPNDCERRRTIRRPSGRRQPQGARVGR